MGEEEEMLKGGRGRKGDGEGRRGKEDEGRMGG